VTLLYTPFDDSYRPSYRQVSRVVQADRLLFTCGQLDTDGNGVVQHPGDLVAQTRRSMRLLHEALEQAGGDATSLFHLHVFYRADGRFDESSFVELVRSLLPDGCAPVMIFQRVDTFPKGVEVEVDGIASRDSVETQAVRHRQAHLVRCGNFLVGVLDCDQDVAGAIDDFAAALADLGLSLDDVCKLRYLSGALGTMPDAVEFELAEAVAGVPAVYTRLPLHASPGRRLVEVYGAIAPDGESSQAGDTAVSQTLWGLDYTDWVSRGSWLFVGGQLPTNSNGQMNRGYDLTQQIHQVMRNTSDRLAPSGVNFSDVVKVSAYYQGAQSFDSWVRSVQIRCDYYPTPGPASTGVEVPHTGHEQAGVVLDCLARLPNLT